MTNYFSFLFCVTCFSFFYLRTYAYTNARTLKCPTSFNIGTSKVVILFLYFLMLLQMFSYLFTVSLFSVSLQYNYVIAVFCRFVYALTKITYSSYQYPRLHYTPGSHWVTTAIKRTIQRSVSHIRHYISKS